MDARQPEQRQVKLRDLIEAMRRLRVAAQIKDPAGDLLTDARGAALAILTPDGKFLSANRSAATLLGYTTGDLVGKQLVDMAPSDDQAVLSGELSAGAGSEFRSFDAVLAGRTGHPTRFVLHQQSIRGNKSEGGALLTLFAEPLILKPNVLNAVRPSRANARDRQVYLTIGQETERQRLASDLHDGLGQALTLIKLMVEDALLRIRRGQVDDAATLLDTTVLRIRETIGDVRQICFELHPLILGQCGLPAALTALCRRVECGTENLAVVFDCDVGDEVIPEHLKADIFRVAQEALNNAMKHAAASTITLSLQRIRIGLRLTIEDNGIGYDTRPLSADDACSTGLGLIGMQHRVESAGGRFSVQSSGKSGTLICATWPI
jgi:two-component system, NarL family, sensor kinase